MLLNSTVPIDINLLVEHVEDLVELEQLYISSKNDLETSLRAHFQLLFNKLAEKNIQIQTSQPYFQLSKSKFSIYIRSQSSVLFSKFHIIPTQFLTKFAALRKLGILKYTLPKKRVPPDKILLFCCDFMFIICILSNFILYHRLYLL